MRKAQSSIEFIIIVLFYILIIVILILALFRLMPSEIGKIKDQQACSQAEIIADDFFNFPGNEIDWVNGNLYEFGLSTSEKMVINYTKWNEARSRGYFNITEDAGIPIPFYITYEAYALNWSTDATPIPLPNQTADGAVYIVRQNKNLLIYAGANTTPFDFQIKIFSPFTSITDSSCTGNLEAGDTNNSISINSGNETILNWYVSENDLDCINLTAANTPDVIFIKDLNENSTIGKKIFVYLGNHTILNNHFGSGGYIDQSKNFCTINRAGLLENNNESIPIKLQVVSWR